MKERYNVRTFLGLTATASKSSIKSITKHLEIDDDDEAGILQEDILPDNLILSVSKDEAKDVALLSLLKEPPFSEFDSIIIYCLRRNECERLASFLRTSLQVRLYVPLLVVKNISSTWFIFRLTWRSEKVYKLIVFKVDQFRIESIIP